MIRIFFKTIWNNRMRNILVLIELFIISLVLVNLTVYLADMIRIMNIRNCYDSSDVIGLSFAPLQEEDGEKTTQSFARLKTRLASNELVESVSFSSNAVPYNYSISTSGYKYGDEEISMANRNVDIEYGEVMKIRPIKGRWFDESDIAKKVKPVLVSKRAEKKFFKGDAVGKVFGEDNFEIIGVVDEFKRSDIEEPYMAGFFFTDQEAANNWYRDILVRVKPGQVENFLKIAESEAMSVMDPKYWTMNAQNSLENMRDAQNSDSAQRRYLGLLIAFFVIINVLLGVIGILWYNTNLRIHEIGIKRAMGSTGNQVKGQLILENLLLGGIALIVVALVFIQVPSIRVFKVEAPVMYLSVAISIVVMTGLILISTWIPTAIASRIRPAEALKTE